ncbi:helix-turn-helix domain-containing protein [Microvirga terrestris]|uniref:helix-turn-helix domain-containing protein n=1 Tax=Microvirga terrestris TaxID=2791024 RepID=UPI0031BB73B8
MVSVRLRPACTQGDLADALGISNVYVNRVLQDFRNHGLISLCKGKLGRCWAERAHDRRRT